MSARIVPPEEAERIRGEALGLTEALIGGQTIHFDDQLQHFNAKQIRERHGLQLRSRLDGKGGKYWWIERPAS